MGVKTSFIMFTPLANLIVVRSPLLLCFFFISISCPAGKTLIQIKSYLQMLACVPVSNIKNENFLYPSFIRFMLPPLDSATGWARELWLKTNFLNGKAKRIQFLSSSFLQSFLFFIFWFFCIKKNAVLFANFLYIDFFCSLFCFNIFGLFWYFLLYWLKSICFFLYLVFFFKVT